MLDLFLCFYVGGSLVRLSKDCEAQEMYEVAEINLRARILKGLRRLKMNLVAALVAT